MVLVKALQKALSIKIEETNNEYIKLVESFKRFREKLWISKMEEGYSESVSSLPGYSEPVPSVFKEYAFQEESLPKPTQKPFLPMIEQQQPILLERGEIQEGKLIPQSETGTGIPVGGGTRRIRRKPTRSSRLVGRTIRRKPKRKRKFVRPRIKRQRRRTIRRRTRR
jgi:hypothetical protein